MRVGTSPRKLKTRLRTLLGIVLLFLATLAVCTGFFVFFTYSGFKIISPLTKGASTVSKESAVAMVKVLCTEEHIMCSDVKSVDGSSIQVTLDSGGVVLLSTQKDLKNQLASLQQVAAQLTIKGKQFKVLDFRFAHVIVLF